MDASKIKLIIWDLDETFWNGTISEQKVAPVKQACDLVLLSSKRELSIRFVPKMMKSRVSIN